MSNRISRFDDLIARVRALHLRATPGPWKTRVQTVKGVKRWWVGGPHFAATYATDPTPADCDLIVEYRMAAPQLAEALDMVIGAHARLTDEAVQLRAENNAMLARVEQANSAVRIALERAAAIAEDDDNDRPSTTRDSIAAQIRALLPPEPTT